VIKGRVHHFSAGGLYNGLVLLTDDESRTYWDHITGLAVHGPLRDEQLEMWSVPLTTVAAALAEDPDLRLSRSRLVFWKRWLTRLAPRLVRGRGWLPFFFHRTMGEKDQRRPAMDHGLGVVVDGLARYYPMTAIQNPVTDDWGGRLLRVHVDRTDGIPAAIWDDGTRPFQVFTRWYGFSFTYPGCTIHDPARPANET
jgi:hypothetical protein